MLIPYSTDAPIYHPPIATIVLIVINVVCYFSLCRWDEVDDFSGPSKTMLVEVQQKLQEALENAKTPEEAEKIQKQLEMLDLAEVDGQPEGSRSWSSPLNFILEFGRGWRPWQWITNMFMHGDIMHLIGNMIFLWSFGLIIEGKIGSFLFTLIYLGMGCVQSIFIQTIMLFSEGGALGASGAIFALLALVVIFAPVNSFECVLIFGRIFVLEIPILVFGGIYLVMNVFFFFMNSAQMSSEALHLAGFMVGVPTGLYMLTRGHVDCEGYDVISHWKGEEGKRSKIAKKYEKVQKAKEKEAENALSVSINFQDQIDFAIAEGNLDVAVALQNKLAINHPGSRWSQKQLQTVIQGYLKQKNYTAAEPLLEKHIEMFEEHHFQLQVTLIKIWLQNHRPRHALRYMRGLNSSLLPPEQNEQFGKLAAYAKQQIAAGVIEVS